MEGYRVGTRNGDRDRTGSKTLAVRGRDGARSGAGPLHILSRHDEEVVVAIVKLRRQGARKR